VLQPVGAHVREPLQPDDAQRRHCMPSQGCLVAMVPRRAALDE
jgi:hypothetical protein